MELYINGSSISYSLYFYCATSYTMQNVSCIYLLYLLTLTLLWKCFYIDGWNHYLTNKIPLQAEDGLDSGTVFCFKFLVQASHIFVIIFVKMMFYVWTKKVKQPSFACRHGGLAMRLHGNVEYDIANYIATVLCQFLMFFYFFCWDTI